MTRIVFSPQADTDVAAMLERLARLAGIAVAEKYASDLDSIYQRPPLFPAIGAPRPELGSQARIAMLSPYIVVYDHQPESETVRIVRIIDGRRNITRQLVRG